MRDIVTRLCTKTLVWYYLNRHRALSNYQDRDIYRVTFADDVESTARKADRHLTIHLGCPRRMRRSSVFWP